MKVEVDGPADHWEDASEFGWELAGLMDDWERDFSSGKFIVSSTKVTEVIE